MNSSVACSVIYQEMSTGASGPTTKSTQKPSNRQKFMFTKMSTPSTKWFRETVSPPALTLKALQLHRHGLYSVIKIGEQGALGGLGGIGGGANGGADGGHMFSQTTSPYQLDLVASHRPLSDLKTAASPPPL
mmetsp:Transcript_76796/g.230442  ORF Transcript_76796/g.230442 Transcript_76796/m.230442 type:complete len:132 (-) Transcript_76796:271-666(-)